MKQIEMSARFIVLFVVEKLVRKITLIMMVCVGSAGMIG
jgi:hypothetical protein